MEEAQRFEIAARLRDLRDNSVESNYSIAEYVDVKERTVAGWASPTKPQGMTYEHAKAVAKLFNVGLDWFWRGRERGETPDVLDALSENQLDRIERRLDEVLTRLTALEAGTPIAGAAPRRPTRAKAS